MKSKLAILLADSASKYKTRYVNAGCDSNVIHDDYDALMSIAQMIEDSADKNAITRAMWRLDTAVRDEIPDEVFWAFNGK
jgi:hypothetical protein